jgi:hypothetical protein
MKDVFKYTFLTVAEIKKFLFVILLFSIFTLIQAFPVISIVSFFLEKLLYLSIGVILIYILKITDNDKEYFATLEKQPFSTFLLHFFPSAMGIMTGFFIIFTVFASFLVIILKFTNSIFILANPHDLLFAISKTSLVAKILLGFYSVYLLFYSYIFLGKFGEALSKETFKESFLSMVSSLFDFKFWVNTFNLKYILIYTVWNIVIITVYSIVIFAYLFYIFPMILNHPNSTLLFVPILVATTTILTYFTFFSAYFAYKSTKN